MSSITIPRIGPGEILSTDHTTTPPSELQTAATSIDTDNLSNESVGYRNIDFSLAPVSQIHLYLEYNGNTQTTFNIGNPGWAGLQQSFFSDSIGINETISGPAWIVSKFRFRIVDVTLDPAYMDDDYYFARFSFDYSDGGGGTTLTYPWGFSLSVRNSGGTLTSDTPLIDTSTQDSISKIQGIWRNVSVHYFIPENVSRAVTDMKWELLLSNDKHAFTVDKYSVMIDVFTR
jgi:hypothetical protein